MLQRQEELEPQSFAQQNHLFCLIHIKSLLKIQYVSHVRVGLIREYHLLVLACVHGFRWSVHVHVDLTP